MSLRFRNTLGGRCEPFEPLEPGHVRMYTLRPDRLRACPRRQLPLASSSPTCVRRALLFSGLRVTWVMNITDVDDKIIRDAARGGHHASTS